MGGKGILGQSPRCRVVSDPISPYVLYENRAIEHTSNNKKTAIAGIALLVLSMTTVHAGDRQLGGLILGGGTGAVVGQAIGGNTESTIVGAAVGGVVGLMVGSELERHHGGVNHPSPVVAHYNRFDDRRYYRHPRPVFRDHYRAYPQYRYDRGSCRQIVTIHKGYYGSKRVIKTVCDGSPRHHYKKYNHYR